MKDFTVFEITRFGFMDNICHYSLENGFEGLWDRFKNTEEQRWENRKRKIEQKKGREKKIETRISEMVLNERKDVCEKNDKNHQYHGCYDKSIFDQFNHGCMSMKMNKNTKTCKKNTHKDITSKNNMKASIRTNLNIKLSEYPKRTNKLLRPVLSPKIASSFFNPLSQSMTHRMTPCTNYLPPTEFLSCSPIPSVPPMNTSCSYPFPSPSNNPKNSISAISDSLKFDKSKPAAAGCKSNLSQNFTKYKLKPKNLLHYSLLDRNFDTTIIQVEDARKHQQIQKRYMIDRRSATQRAYKKSE